MNYPSKFFFLGFNKTGTTSIYKSLDNVGIKTCHSLEYVLSSYLRDLSFFDRFEAFTDGSGQNYHWLTEHFPDASFTLLTRNNYQWIVSRFNHARRDGKKSWSGKIQFYFYNQFPTLLEKQIKQKILYESRVRHYFQLKAIPLLEIDIEQEKEAAFQKLNVLIGRPLQALHVNRGRMQGAFNNPSFLSEIVTKAEATMQVLLKDKPAVLTEPNYSRILESVFYGVFKIRLKAYVYSRANGSSGLRRALRNLSSILVTLIILIFDRKNKYY
ncbi:MAG: hypothetical protein ACI8R9_002318 [Paraglaciecola sp.]|jgi:hypothetical protein